jgi:hypothetical protein
VAEDSVAGILGKLALGGAVGFALFFVVTGLGGRGEVAPPLPPRPKDDKRLSFVMVEPKVVGHPMSFRLREGEPSKIYAIKELIARVKDGGRTDVELRASGDVIHGAWDEARALIKRGGLTVSLAETSPGPPVSTGSSWRESPRGQYRRGSL